MCAVPGHGSLDECRGRCWLGRGAVGAAGGRRHPDRRRIQPHAVGACACRLGAGTLPSAPRCVDCPGRRRRFCRRACLCLPGNGRPGRGPCMRDGLQPPAWAVRPHGGRRHRFDARRRNDRACVVHLRGHFRADAHARWCARFRGECSGSVRLLCRRVACEHGVCGCVLQPVADHHAGPPAVARLRARCGQVRPAA